VKLTTAQNCDTKQQPLSRKIQRKTANKLKQHITPYNIQTEKQTSADSSCPASYDGVLSEMVWSGRDWVMVGSS